ncbi:ferredoxin--NADP reductase [Roseomonas populi]|uniref:ferredoxin--NADP(+) reductase n=1 Tax=Roseomonas populi TaxID=3121582 RepID=A0ABT1X632_9PROT|nr:ferredoxin--NADP reductase [Roseomonas pecuniae]MCR0983556.1 ferredoxin--NADP reductase [Roseomonas pecuniae]
MSAFHEAEVLEVRHWTDRLFSFRCTREPGFRFLAGQFAMIGLIVDGKPLMRAYSVASPPWEETLEFLSIKVQDGPLTSRLQNIKPGDTVLINRKPVGTLLLDNLLPGKNLWFLSTGTGLAPFMSLIREPEAYDRFEKVIVTHTVRDVEELAYREYITQDLMQHEFLGEMVREKLVYYPSVTRQDFPTRGRITELMDSGRIYADLGLPPLSPENDRVMLCGSPEMLADTKARLEALGMKEGSAHEPAHFVVERAFVDK